MTDCQSTPESCHPEFGCDCARRLARLEEINVELLRDTAKVELRLLKAEQERDYYQAQADEWRDRAFAAKDVLKTANDNCERLDGERAAAEARVEALSEALRFYAEQGEWLDEGGVYHKDMAPERDFGALARAALACPPQQRGGAVPKVVGGTGIHSPSELGSRAACPPQQPGEVTTCLRCGRRSVVAHGGGFKCRDCGAACPPPEEEKWCETEREEVCPDCGGDGDVDGRPCEWCDGTGLVAAGCPPPEEEK